MMSKKRPIKTCKHKIKQIHIENLTVFDKQDIEFCDGVNVIIAGGMGAGAIEIFDGHGIKVFTGTQGIPEAAVNKYLEGTLTTNGAVCRQHQQHGECGGHQ